MIPLDIFGVQSQKFGISFKQPPSEPPPEFPWPLVIFLIVLGAVSIALVSYIAYKRIQSQRRTRLEKFLSKFTEFLNEAAKENSSPNFKFVMEDLAYDIYKHYGEEIDKFTGILKPFHNMKELIEKHLHISFLSPLKIVDNPKIKLSKAEKEMVEKARTFMKENNFTYFYALYLLPENACTPKDYQTIFDLIEKGVFQPTEKEKPKVKPSESEKDFSKKSIVDKRMFEEQEGITGVIICDLNGVPIYSDIDIEISESTSADITSLIRIGKQLVKALKEGELKYLRLETSKGAIMIAKEEQLILILLKGVKRTRDRDDRDRFPYPYIFTHPRPPDDFEAAAQVQLRTLLTEKDPEYKVNCQYCGRRLTKEEQFSHSCKKKPE